MRYGIRKASGIAVSAVCLSGLTRAGAQQPALRGLDPVELAEGKEVAGNASISVQRGRFRFVFATPMNQKKFNQEPERYAPQFGGACMKMGPLAGPGSGDRFFVHDGFIYLFASDSCIEAFKANPERFIDRPDRAPRGSAMAVERAKTLLAKAVEAIGGEKTLKSLKTIQTRYMVTDQASEKTPVYLRTLATSFKGFFAFREDYGASQGGWLLNREGGFVGWEHGAPAEDSVREYMVREYYRQPVPLLRAWLDGDAHAVHVGQGKVGEAPVEQVAVAMMGATTTLFIDPESGRILKAAWRGRVAVGISNVEKTFSDFRKVQGLTLPFSETVVADGKALENPRVEVESIRVNETIDPALLAKPR